MNLEQLRWRLTLWYGGLSMIVCVVLAAVAALIFHSAFNFTISENLRAQTREIRPAIDFSSGKPSLAAWAHNAEARAISLMYTVQLYDCQGTLLEAYGPPGIKRLGNGVISGMCDAGPIKVHSRSRELVRGGKLKGYLQIEESTLYRDQAVTQLLLTLSIIAPLLVAGLGFCAYIMAGQALYPTESALALLRRFVTDAGHELNTPITIIQAALETLEKRGGINGASEVLASIDSAANRLQDLSTKLVLLAKAESLENLSPLEHVNLSDLLGSIIDERQNAFEHKGIKLLYERNASIPALIHVDSFAIIVNNLIENALKYTDTGGTVNVSLVKEGNTYQLSVKDTGIGIPAESIPLIFDRFYRVDKARSRKVGGVGLGLSIVKAIVESQNGTIKVESSPGNGSTFVIALPTNHK